MVPWASGVQRPRAARTARVVLRVRACALLLGVWAWLCVCVRSCVCVLACACLSVRARVRACVRARVCVRACVRARVVRVWCACVCVRARVCACAFARACARARAYPTAMIGFTTRRTRSGATQPCAAVCGARPVRRASIAPLRKYVPLGGAALLADENTPYSEYKYLLPSSEIRTCSLIHRQYVPVTLFRKYVTR